mmetsp:Transcript_25794/g.43039  ORF Transcript_25794/g.43039 Transcript_25794/m.43039 type:complete len:247 (+) Transcript_25794:278-1018(+)
MPLPLLITPTFPAPSELNILLLLAPIPLLPPPPPLLLLRLLLPLEPPGAFFVMNDCHDCCAPWISFSLEISRFLLFIVFKSFFLRSISFSVSVGCICSESGITISPSAPIFGLRMLPIGLVTIWATLVDREERAAAAAELFVLDEIPISTAPPLLLPVPLVAAFIGRIYARGTSSLFPYSVYVTIYPYLVISVTTALYQFWSVEYLHIHLKPIVMTVAASDGLNCPALGGIRCRLEDGRDTSSGYS